MTINADVNGLTGIKALNFDGATADYYFGKSANVAAMTTTANAPLVFSISNYASISTTATVFNANDTSIQKPMNCIGLLLVELARRGLCTVYYDGTNKI